MTRITGRARGAASVLAALLAGAAPLAAQSITAGTLSGTVTDAQGRLLSDAHVRASAGEMGVARSAYSRAGGRFELQFLPPGDYAVLVERLGYRPKRIESVPIRPGQAVDLVIQLEPAPPPVDRVDVERFPGAGLGLSRAGASEWFPPFDLARLPAEGRELADLARLSTAANATDGTDGLSHAPGRTVIDGVPFTAARHPDLPGAWGASPAFPLSAFAHAELVIGGVDVEWPDGASAVLSGYTRRGTPGLEVRSFGLWSGAPLRSSKYFDAGDLEPNVLQGGLLFAGPVIDDTAHFVLGVEAWRMDTPLPRAWGLDAAAAELLPVARSVYDVELGAYQRPRLVRADAVSAFGRFDWEIASGHTLGVRASGATLPAAARDLGSAYGGIGSTADGADFAAAATLASRFSDRWMHELRLGISTSRREYRWGSDAAQDLFGADVPATRIVGGALAFGADPGLPGRFQRADFYGSQAVYHVRGAHRLKFGVGVSVAMHDRTYLYGSGGLFTFGGVDQFARREGAFFQAVGPASAARFNVPQFSVFAQDTWTVAPGVRLVGGLRWDRVSLPAGEVRPDTAWARLTGIARQQVPSGISELSPRFGFTWDVQEQGEWVLRAGAGIYHDRLDPGILGELITYDGRIRVRRGLGILSEWPGLPDEASAPTLGSRLAVLGPHFRPPRTARLSIGLTRAFAGTTALHLAATYRSTEFLPRRHDLNLSPAPAATDQHGRPIYGRLVQQGSLLTAEPGSNRRFAAFDIVSALDPDGRSRQWAMTVALEHRTGGPFTFFGRYTFSRTTDDWLGGRAGGPEAGLPPFAAGAGPDDWADGRSDVDIPHRLAIGAEAALGSFRIAGVYRYRSGDPFTPGFRDGVDVNGDGSGVNDPAFIDDAIPGIADLVARHGCLRDRVGAFAERNSCRGPGIHTLDLRLTLGLIRLGSYPAELIVDGLNLLDPDIAEPDRALYLIDPAGSLVEDGAGNVTIPLIANPHFAEPLGRRSTGRTVRVGLRINY